MAKEEELKRIDLKVNVSCCEGCRRKVMKAMSMKGVLRAEIKPSHDRVTMVGDVDAKVLVKKLAKVGKIAEALLPSSDGDGKRRDHGGKKQDGDKPPPPQAEEKSGDGRSAADNKAAACRQECKKCAHGAAAAADDKNGGDKEKVPPPFKSAEEGDGVHASKWSCAPDHAVEAEEVHQFQHYHRAEPTMVVPAYYPPPPTAAPYYGYYAAPPPTMAGAPRRLRPQPSRFDADYFNDDNTVGCSVM